MITCPNCSHENPEGANLCETCYTPLPQHIPCPQCGGSILSNATFCGQCGFILNENSLETITEESNNENVEMEVKSSLETPESEENINTTPFLEINLEKEVEEIKETNEEAETETHPILAKNTPNYEATQLQVQKPILINIQTDKILELPEEVQVIHIGKENDHIPPDLDLSGFPDSQFVSRIHAEIRVEGNSFYIEDVGSSNGTYINHIPLPQGNRHLLKNGDRIAFGKEDKVSFLFKITDEL
jgi:pSer/pThr/pTyr-binding forkhead associated (FHA) protein